MGEWVTSTISSRKIARSSLRLLLAPVRTTSVITIIRGPTSAVQPREASPGSTRISVITVKGRTFPSAVICEMALTSDRVCLIVAMFKDAGTNDTKRHSRLESFSGHPSDLRGHSNDLRSDSAKVISRTTDKAGPLRDLLSVRHKGSMCSNVDPRSAHRLVRGAAHPSGSRCAHRLANSVHRFATSAKPHSGHR